MAYPMHVEKSRRSIQCSVNTCRNRDTYLFFRGRDYGSHPMHLCGECVHDILEQFVGVVGAEAAYALLADVVERINPKAVETADEAVETAVETAGEADAPKKRGRKAE